MLMAMDAEQAVLGGLLLEPERFAEVVCTAEDFAREDHRVIFQAIAALIRARNTVDLVTVTSYLEQENTLEDAGGSAYLAVVMRDTPGGANVSAYSRIVASRSRSRKAVEICSGLIERSTEEGAIDGAVRSLMELTLRQSDESEAVGDALSDVLDEIDRIQRGDVKQGLNTGLGRLDKALGGLCPGHLIIVAARPAMGKTAFGGGILLANRHLPTGFMSTEQPRRQIIQRMLASVGDVSAHAMRLGKLNDRDWESLGRASAVLRGMRCYINEQPAPTIDVVARQARKWKYEHDIQLLLFDYIQRIKSAGKEPRHQQVEQATRDLKELARELEIPVVALCQVSRAVESREDKRPQMSDLRDSGAIEQEADSIVTLYRDEVYHDSPENQGQAEVSVIKNRHGPLGKITCTYNGASLRFEDHDQQYSGLPG